MLTNGFIPILRVYPGVIAQIEYMRAGSIQTTDVKFRDKITSISMENRWKEGNFNKALMEVIISI